MSLPARRGPPVGGGDGEVPAGPADQHSEDDRRYDAPDEHSAPK